LNGAVETFADAIGLRMTGFGLAVIDVLNRQVELVFMVLQRTTVFRAPIRLAKATLL
jgi:hypothetical protein